MKDLSIENINTVMNTALEIADAQGRYSYALWTKLLSRFKDQIFSCDQMLVALAVCYLNRNNVSMTVMREVMLDEEYDAFMRGIRPLTMAWVGTEPPIEILKKLPNEPDPDFFLDRTVH